MAGKPCIVIGCTELTQTGKGGRGMCPNHYMTQYRREKRQNHQEEMLSVGDRALARIAAFKRLAAEFDEEHQITPGKHASYLRDVNQIMRDMIDDQEEVAQALDEAEADRLQEQHQLGSAKVIDGDESAVPSAHEPATKPAPASALAKAFAPVKKPFTTGEPTLRPSPPADQVEPSASAPKIPAQHEIAVRR